MSKARRDSRLRMVALLSVILGVGILFADWGKAPQDEGKLVTKVEIFEVESKAGQTHLNSQ